MSRRAVMRHRLVLIPVALLCGCIASLRYSGDGTFTDRGWWEANNRFVVDLGPVDLSTVSRKEYSLSKLPSELFTIGLEQESEVFGEDQAKTLKTRVRVRLVNERNERVIDTESVLGDWAWSQMEDGHTKRTDAFFVGSRQRRDDLADGGWGTFFEPRRNGAYRLVFEVLEPDSATDDLSFRLVAKGGGWK